jgi:hypothetical protein
MAWSSTGQGRENHSGALSSVLPFFPYGRPENKKSPIDIGQGIILPEIYRDSVFQQANLIILLNHIPKIKICQQDK